MYRSSFDRRCWSLALCALGCTDGLSPGPATLPDSTPPTAVPAGYHVTPSGTSDGTGTLERPWALSTALSGAGGAVAPGDTIWVHGGMYAGGVRSTLTGAPGLPVVVRAYPGEQPVINGAGIEASTLSVAGEWVTFWGLELTNTDPDRIAARANVVANRASHARYINLVIHDGGVAFYSFPDVHDVEISGALIYNNGWEDSTGGHGHGIYVQSDAGPVRVLRNVVFNQFGYGIHAYSDQGVGALRNLQIENNVSFNNGGAAVSSAASNILVGGYEPADGVVVHANHAFYPPTIARINLHLGYDTLRNGTMVVSENRVIGGSPVLEVARWSVAALRRNLLAGTDLLVQLEDPAPLAHAWGGNRYLVDSRDSAWALNGLALPLDGWRARTGIGGTDQTDPTTPDAAEVFVITDPYERGRAMIVIYNWTAEAFVPVDLSEVLTVGDAFEVRNVQGLSGPPQVAGIYDGQPARLLLVGATPPPPIGMPTSRAPVTGPAFDVFLVSTRSVR